jgi:5-methylcytosine-specific restriction endonuclease McrA
MADYHTNSSFLFPLQPIRCHPKSTAERRHITEIRLQLFERSGGRCELQLGPQCWDWISWDTMHTAHIVSRARGGPWDLDNLLAACPACHAAQHNGGFKVCPPKPGGAL